MEGPQIKIKPKQIIYAQFSAIIIWFLITTIQWINNPKGSPGLAIPLTVRGIESFSIFLISGFFILLNEKFKKDSRKYYFRLALVILVYFGSIIANILSIFIRNLFGYSPPKIDDYFFVQSLHFYIPIILVLIIYGITKNRIELQYERENKLKAENLAQQAKWMMLRYQVNPHFLFNALNTIRALIGVDDESARKVLTEMSEYFRYSLSSEDKFIVTVEEEIKAIQSYLEIQKVRFKDRIKCKVNLQAGTEDFMIPIFSIQTLVENAIKYGLKTNDDKFFIDILSGINEDSIELIVKNSGKLFPVLSDKNTPMSTHKGLDNLKNRLKHLDPQSTFSLNEKDGYVIAKISMKSKLV